MIYLEGLRTDVRDSGDYKSDPHIKDGDLNLWLNQAFSKAWTAVVNQGEGHFIKETLLVPQYHEGFKKHFVIMPSDFIALEDIYLRRGSEVYYLERAPSLNRNIDKERYRAEDRIMFFYSPGAPALIERLPENPESDYQHIIPVFWKYFLIDYAIKRSRMKQDDEIREIDVESFQSYQDILSQSRNKNNHFPPRPTPYRNNYSLAFGDDYRYSYFPMGKNLFLV